MIYTLTANPAIDYNIACDGLSANTVTRTRNAVYTPNGKGLNVSFTLDHYGVDRRHHARQRFPQRRPRYRVQHGQRRCRHQCSQRAGDV